MSRGHLFLAISLCSLSCLLQFNSISNGFPGQGLTIVHTSAWRSPVSPAMAPGAPMCPQCSTCSEHGCASEDVRASKEHAGVAAK